MLLYAMPSQRTSSHSTYGKAQAIGSLIRVCGHYYQHWEPWASSELCFLSQDEVATVELAHTSGLLSDVARMLQISIDTANYELQWLKLKLNLGKAYFHACVDAGLPAGSGQLEHNLTGMRPLVCFPLRNRLLGALIHYSSLTTVADLRSCSDPVQELSKTRGLGTKTAQEICAIIEQCGVPIHLHNHAT